MFITPAVPTDPNGSEKKYTISEELEELLPNFFVYVWKEPAQDFRFEAKCIDENDYRDENGNIKYGSLNKAIKKVKDDLAGYAEGFEVPNIQNHATAYVDTKGTGCPWPSCKHYDICCEMYEIDFNGTALIWAANELTPKHRPEDPPVCVWESDPIKGAVDVAAFILQWKSYADSDLTDFDFDSWLTAQIDSNNDSLVPFIEGRKLAVGDVVFIYRGKCKQPPNNDDVSRQFDKWRCKRGLAPGEKCKDKRQL